ncbi:shikimate kinase [Heyndrickxia sporothermodurans]|uniref:Shikimate kinase n=1 Tax=Heyndrickxia sporothermodurans TaxID=46224 RepID=A0A150L775_9BACI|nr:shikimate kinase [Heyndrickxia sporothermodurans]KYD07856.1 Shikimate kinase I [Heyndrickxia sporothermodurans]MBL5768520.1 shikimate kinase [Heyndrickxia sporothermodurans]MBL5772185.1 shikimate kinase [Heyndrickxia sporothermodurans]MBL5775748.1 shikimate kinase [Heyndrickxia sporothermodurans]MBL5777194.1 shikimate kinase [Heyndrickxia sporothermodurans]
MTNKPSSLNNKSIVFIGFMGVGKTTIGEAVAKKLNRDFIDIDQEIEKEFQISTTEIFNIYGEKVFREKEKALISEYCKCPEKIISVGGGAFLQDEIKNLCLSECIVIYLHLSWEAWKERLDLIIDSRPVLKGRTLEETEQLFYTRQNIYASHHLKVETDQLTVDEITDRIVDLIQKTQ